MPHGFARLANLPQHRRRGNAIAATEIGHGRTGPILGY
jgi:hypothetical protein